MHELLAKIKKHSKLCVAASCEPPRIKKLCYFLSPISNIKKLYSDGLLKKTTGVNIYSGGSLEYPCEVREFHWPFTGAVGKNNSENRF
jgi:hypothetical protein